MTKIIVKISLVITMMTLLLGIGSSCVSAATAPNDFPSGRPTDWLLPWITFEPGPVTAISDGHGGMKTLLPIDGKFPGGI